jgi:hypothetical protein
MSLAAAAVDRDLELSGCRVGRRLGEGAGQRGQQFFNLQVHEGQDKEAAHARSESKIIEIGCVARPGGVAVHGGREQMSRPNVMSSATPAELEKATVPGALAVPRVALGVPSLWPMSAISEMSTVLKVVFPATIVPVASTDR